MDSDELDSEKQKKLQKALAALLPYRVVPSDGHVKVVESEVALNRDIMHVDSDANLSYIPLRENGKVVFYPMLLPYIQILNDDLTKSYLKEEELAWARMQLGHIQNAIAFATDYGLFLPYINKQISQAHSFLVVTRSRNMAAPKLSKTSITFEESKQSKFLLEDELQRAANEGTLGKILGKIKPKKDDHYFKVNDTGRGINL